MPTPPTRILLVCLAAFSAALIAACGSPQKTSPPTAAASAKTCTPARLQTHAKGVLTVATDSPAYPPYFEHDKPSNGQGFESAVAYAVAHQLGYRRTAVKWVSEPFDASYAPGPKAFDFDINEISITKPRARVVDFSPGYYTNPQAIIVASDSPYAHAKSLADLKGANIGVQIGTTSLSAAQAQIKPTHAPQVFNTSNDVVQAFKIHRVNAIVVDLATAFELTATALPHTTIAGQFSAPGGDQWGLLMAKGSPIAPCVSRAVDQLKSDGTLQQLNRRWIASGSQVPVLR